MLGTEASRRARGCLWALDIVVCFLLRCCLFVGIFGPQSPWIFVDFFVSVLEMSLCVTMFSDQVEERSGKERVLRVISGFSVLAAVTWKVMFCLGILGSSYSATRLQPAFICILSVLLFGFDTFSRCEFAVDGRRAQIQRHTCFVLALFGYKKIVASIRVVRCCVRCSS
jgi:hypothetical protein